jgi:hypothetical protein
MVLAPGVAVAFAQAPPPGRLDVSLAGVWASGVSLGGTSATLTPNQATADVTLFETETVLSSASNVELRVSYLLTDEWAAETGVSYGRPEVQTTISSDAELAASSTVLATERLHEYVFDASVVYQPRGWQFADGRARLFLLAGAGYLRDLHEQRFVIEHGVRYHLVGGAKYLFAVRPGRLIRGLGVRLDARFYLRDGGVELAEESARPAGALGAALLLVF